MFTATGSYRNRIFPSLKPLTTTTPFASPSRISNNNNNNNNNNSNSLPMPPSNTTRVIAEYAKSNRSSCKTCSNPIPSKSLRLGLVTRDHQRGFDLTKWHHLACFPNGAISSVELISGFNSLQSGDKEALRKLVAGCNGLAEEVSNGDEQASGKRVNKTRKRDEDGQEIELEEKNLNKIKFSPTNTVIKEFSAVNTGVKADIAFSLADVSEKYKDALLLPKWKAYQTLIFLEQDDGLHDSSKIAAFDFDGCLAKTSVRRVGADAWSLMYPSIPYKLQSLYSDGYKLVIFTNESNIERWKNKRQVAVDSKIGRLNNFIKLVQVPIQVFIACGYSDGKVEDPFRKPNPGMWQLMEKQFNSGISVDMDKSFYVGDAAGRESDHSDADIKFAQAIGLKFYVPEEFFGA